MKQLKISLKNGSNFYTIYFCKSKKVTIFALAIRFWLSLTGEMAERSNAAVLKTVDCNRSGGSNPSFSAEFGKLSKIRTSRFFLFKSEQKVNRNVH